MRPKVLIVDDEALIRMLYQKHIERAGYELLTASTAEQGLAMVQAEQPAVVIMDVIMPGRDGLAALRQLKANEATREIPVIIFTASTSQAYDETRKEAAASGASVFMTKPISPAQLVSEIYHLAPIVG